MPPPTLPSIPPEVLRLQLRTASADLASRGLTSSAKWCAELLCSLPPRTASTSTGTTSVPQERSYSTSTPVKDPPPFSRASTSTINTTSTILPHPRQSLPGLSSEPISRLRAGSARDSLGSVMESELGSSPAGGGGVPRGHPFESSRIGAMGVQGEEGEDVGMDDFEKRDERGGDEMKEDQGHNTASTSRIIPDQDALEEDIYTLGLAYYRTHEFLRAAHGLRQCTGGRGRWLRSYSKYLAGEKRASEDSGDLLGVKDKGAVNPFAQELLDEMNTWGEEFIDSDGFLLYLKSLLLLSLPPLSPSPFSSKGPLGKQKQVEEDEVLDVRLVAIDLLVRSVNKEPLNWSGWLKLAACIEGGEELDAVLPHLPSSSPFTLFFFVHATLEIHAAENGLHDTLDELEEVFPGSTSVKGMRGLIHYHVREFEDATTYFSELRETDPYRIEDIDIYSNILYVSEKRAELAQLAQEYTKMDRSRAEVCCLVGNYYSLRREHEKAIQYFRRALRLDRGYLSAWTLMGHEYVEIKNTNAAIASYRRAVDVNRKDYRAWYGLGQTYELLGEPFYALSYYQKATALRPYDARMWSALAVCYEKLKRYDDAIKSYKRALVSSEPGENDTALRIGRLYSLLGNSPMAYSYHKRALAEGIKGGLSRLELSKMYLWLVREEIQRETRGNVAAANSNDDRSQELERGDLVAAEIWLAEVGAVQEVKEEVKLLTKEIEALFLQRD